MQFPQSRNQLSDSDLHGIVMQAHSHARCFNLRSEKEHLKYLVLCYYLGTNFFLDPLHSAEIDQSGMRDSKEPRECCLSRLLEHATAIRNAREKDLVEFSRIVRGFEAIYHPKYSYKDFEVVAQCVVSIWPNVCDTLGAHVQTNFISEAIRFSRDDLFLGRQDQVCYAALAMYFGTYFARDPQYPWAIKAMKIFDPYQRRHALGDGVLTYLDSRGFQNE